MGKSTNAVSIRLGNKNIFWKSELYSYYYNNTLAIYLKINYILNKLLRAYGIFSISNKFYFINNIFLLLVNFKKFYWKYACKILKLFGKRKRKCPFLLHLKYKICTNVRCTWYKRVDLDNKDKFVYLDNVYTGKKIKGIDTSNLVGYIPKWQFKIMKTDSIKKISRYTKFLKHFSKLKKKIKIFSSLKRHFDYWFLEKQYYWCRYFSNKRYLLRGIAIFRARQKGIPFNKSNYYYNKQNFNNKPVLYDKNDKKFEGKKFDRNIPNPYEKDFPNVVKQYKQYTNQRKNWENDPNKISNRISKHSTSRGGSGKPL